jgi:hypothetical protein
MSGKPVFSFAKAQETGEERMENRFVSMEIEDISDLVPKVDPKQVAENAGKLCDSIGYYDGEMQRLLSVMSYEEGQKIPEYESKYLQGRIADSKDAKGGKPAANVMLILAAAAIAVALTTYFFGGALWDLGGREMRHARASLHIGIILFVSVILLLYVLAGKARKNRKADYPKFSSEDRLTLYADYSFQKKALEKMLNGGGR